MLGGTPIGAATPLTGPHVEERSNTLSKEALYPGDRFRMSDDVLDACVGQLLESQPGLEVVVSAWQGGETEWEAVACRGRGQSTSGVSGAR